VTGADTTGASCRSLVLSTLLTGVLTGLIGCSNFDEFSWRKMNFEVFRDPPEPLVVIKTSKDGNERARALRCLKEPLQNGGSQEEQDTVVAVLNYSASHETQPLCRLAAIQALRRFKDPRAVDGLKEAYYRAGSFTPQTARLIRIQALTALGESGHPSALQLLIRIVREPPAEGTDFDRQQKLEERITAIRALRHFQQAEAVSTLVEALRASERLRSEDDVVVRNAAHESLVAVTGKHLPPDAQTWGDFLQNPNHPVYAKAGPSIGDKILELTGLR
jgi:hypothetical protein